jgi:hypothetical protein
MVAGFWYNQDGLPLQYGTQKAIPEVGGDYLMYGDNREIETYVALVPTQFGSAGVQIPAAPTSFSGTGTPIQAGIQSLTTMIPLQTTAVNTGGTSITFTATQMFIEEVTTEVLIGATGGTSLSMGLVTTSQLPGSPNATFVQLTPNGPNTHILNGQLIAQQSTVGQRVTYTNPGTHGFNWLTAPGTLVAGGGDWVGINMPLVTNAITPLPQMAWLSAIATGAYTNGLIKVRIKYSLYGDISY